MRMEQLRYFVDVARTQSISKSAGNLFISPQGLSQAISSLEKEFGMLFFERAKNGMVLTGKGEAFLGYALELCDGFDDFEAKVAQLAREGDCARGRRRFRLYLPALVMHCEVFVPLMNKLEEGFPQLEFSVAEKDLSQLIGLSGELAQSDCSIALASVPDFSRESLYGISGLEVCVPLTMPAAVKVHKTSPLAAKKHLTCQELASFPLACFNEPVMESILSRMVGEYGEPNIVVKSSASTMLSMRKDTAIITAGIMPAMEDTVVIPIDGAAMVDIAIVSSRGSSSLVGDVVACVEGFLMDWYPVYRCAESRRFGSMRSAL